MPAIKCPSCEYRNFHSEGFCTNCGTVLTSEFSPTGPIEEEMSPSPRRRRRSSAGGEPSRRNSTLLQEEDEELSSTPIIIDAVEEDVVPEQPSSEDEPKPKRVPARRVSSRKNRSNGSPARRRSPVADDKAVPVKRIANGHASDEHTEEGSVRPRRLKRNIHEQPSHPEDELAPHKSVRPRRLKRDIPNSEEEEEPDLEHKPKKVHRKTKTVEFYPEDEEDEPDQEHREIAPYIEDEEDPEDEPYARQIVSYTDPHPDIFHQSTALAPYAVDTALQPIESLLPDIAGTFVSEEKQKNAEPWLTDKLPWGFPRRPPDVAGTIIFMQNSQEIPDYPNIVLAIVNMLTELVWMLPNDPRAGQKEDERLQITVLRVRTSDDERKDARLVGYLRGANLTLGDVVSLWGFKNKGSLYVQKGYNHTSKAVVSTHALSLVLPAMTLLIIGAVAFLLFLSWSNFWGMLSSFFSAVTAKR